MKTPPYFLRSIFTGACLLVLGHVAAHAANIWDGGSGDDSNWNTAANWDDDTVPTSPAALTFDGTVRLDPFNDLEGFQVNGFTFGAEAGSFVISGNAIALGGNILNNGINGQTQTIDLDMALVGSSTRSIKLSDLTAGTAGGVTLNGNISGDGALSTLNSRRGTLTLNGNSSHTGGTTLDNGVSSQPQTLNLGHANALGTGTFTWNTGSSALSYVDNTSGSAMIIANEVSLTGAGRMRLRVTDDITFTGDITNSGSNRRFDVEAGTVTIDGDIFLSDNSENGYSLHLTDAGDLTINGVISNYSGEGVGTAGGITKLSGGTLTLSNEANTYTGATTISRANESMGTLVVTKLADGGEPSSIGASSNAASNLIFNGPTTDGVLRYIGSGDSTDRLFSIEGSGTDVTIESSGTGGLHFTNSGVIGTSGTSANKTLVLGGTYAGENTMAAELTTDGGGSELGLRKEGPGTWELTNTNGYIDATTVNGGTLRVSGTGSINSSSGITVNDPGSTFEYTSSVGLDRDVTVETGGAFAHSGSTNYSGSFTWTNGTLGGTNWNGTLDGRVVNANRVISPGNSPGTASTGNQEWADDGGYIWEINSATGIAGSDPGWDLVTGTGTLTISADSANPFTIYVNSLNLANEAGDAANFNMFTDYEWLIADFAESIVGFDSDSFAIDLSGFSNNTAPGSEFAVMLGNTVLGGDDSQIYLTYTIPEPSTMALLAGCAVLALCVLRRRNP